MRIIPYIRAKKGQRKVYSLFGQKRLLILYSHVEEGAEVVLVEAPESCSVRVMINRGLRFKLEPSLEVSMKIRMREMMNNMPLSPDLNNAIRESLFPAPPVLSPTAFPFSVPKVAMPDVKVKFTAPVTQQPDPKNELMKDIIARGSETLLKKHLNSFTEAERKFIRQKIHENQNPLSGNNSKGGGKE